MTKANKEVTDQKIRALEWENSTNLWGGIVDGLQLFEGKEDSGRVPAVMVLTDGQPNTKYVLILRLWDGEEG
jgi:Mg-chelatase subunit ChlD